MTDSQRLDAAYQEVASQIDAVKKELNAVRASLAAGWPSLVLGRQSDHPSCGHRIRFWGAHAVRASV